MAKRTASKETKHATKVTAKPAAASAGTVGDDPTVRILEVFILPPNAIARVGGSPTPLESYTWDVDPTIAGRAQTVIVPDVSFDVTEDGSIRPFLPSNIRFRDGAFLRPVAPFLELWCRVMEAGDEDERPMTLGLLERAGVSEANLTFRVTAANKKAERRTNDPSCGFQAQVVVVGTDHAPKPLLAISPNRPDSQPLVLSDRPIPLGHVQVIRPIKASEMGADLSAIRLRFTPAGGEVYGPPTAAVAVAPGTNRSHMMVKPENRILNPQSPWTQYNADETRFLSPQPSDTYDGSDIDQERSWGVVDDTCDVLVECDLVIDGVRIQAQSRIAAGPPHFAPDRRPFVSLADDLKDRDEPLPGGTTTLTQGESQEDLEHRINDLFQRALEVAGLVNVDANRNRAIRTNGDSTLVPGTPHTDNLMMTTSDVPYANLTATDWQSVPHARLPLSDFVQEAHGPLADLDSMVIKLREEAARIRLMIRPPYGYFRQLPTVPAAAPNRAFRDPRIARDMEYDMRMPPFMRDSDATAMSLTHRQYDELMALVDALEVVKAELARSIAAAPKGEGAPIQEDTPIRRRVAEFIQTQRLMKRPTA
jgi:hypothetical protein